VVRFAGHQGGIVSRSTFRELRGEGAKNGGQPSAGRGGRLGFATYYIFSIGCRVKQYAGKSLKFRRDNAKNLSLFAPENAISA
jgi:hypothetical protein